MRAPSPTPSGPPAGNDPEQRRNRSSAERHSVGQLLERLTAPGGPSFAVLHRPAVDPRVVEVLVGDVVTVDTLRDLPEPGRLPTLAVVPYRQIRERQFEAVDDGTPLLVLRASSRVVAGVDELLPRLPPSPEFTETGYDVPDDEYRRQVRSVLDDEIATGSGSNFVIHRCLTGTVAAPPPVAALAALRQLLLGETNAYWSFVVHTPSTTLVGASPERHVSVDAGVARMNPISGTLRHPPGGFTAEADYRAAVLDFLADPKERDELAMVVDEELKMMAVVGDRGGLVRGPYLKRMSQLTHTEYVIEGRTSFDVRDVLTATMFAPTVTGSPIRNACRVIARHERRGRRYYAGVLALIGLDDDGQPSLDAPILIRTAEIRPDGGVRIAAGATLVRGSDPDSELAETRAKAAGILAAFTSQTSPVIMQSSAAAVYAGSPDHGEVGRVLAERNRTLARFWLEPRDPHQNDVSRGRVVVVDNEDDFTGMLAHQLESLGLTTDVREWDDASPLPSSTLVVLGPGPGDPRDVSDPRIAALHAIVKQRLAARAPMLGICLGHQVIGHGLGLRVERLAQPDQGRQTGIDLFGIRRRVGFYNSYVVTAENVTAEGTPAGLTFSADGNRVHALRGDRVAGLQFHPESVLTTDGLDVLRIELDRLMAD